MALYLTHPSSMVGRIVHKGDVFVDGNESSVVGLDDSVSSSDGVCLSQ